MRSETYIDLRPVNFTVYTLCYTSNKLNIFLFFFLPEIADSSGNSWGAFPLYTFTLTGRERLRFILVYWHWEHWCGIQKRGNVQVCRLVRAYLCIHSLTVFVAYHWLLCTLERVYSNTLESRRHLKSHLCRFRSSWNRLYSTIYSYHNYWCYHGHCRSVGMYIFFRSLILRFI